MKSSFRLFASLAVVSAALLFASAQSASAYTFKTIYTFCKPDTTCKPATAAFPNGGLIGDAEGNLYGVALASAVYELIPNANRTKWRYKALHNFKGKGGGAPYGVLVMDTAGDLYGTTSGGGKGAAGTAFELVPDATHTKWKLTTLYQFCTKKDCADGYSPRVGLTYAGQQSGALYDGTSPLYGTTVAGGTAEGCGVVFQLASDSGTWKEKVIHTFNADVTPNDGCTPNAVFEDSDGSIVGTTQSGSSGSVFAGTVFKLVPNHAQTKWAEQILMGFRCSDDNQCPNGAVPLGNVTRVGANLFGTTSAGGTGAGADCATVVNGGAFCGVAFEVAADGTFSKIYDFCSLENCADGMSPGADLLADSAGNLFGAGGAGIGDGGAGELFEIDNTGHEQVLHGFTGGADGKGPNPDLYMDAAGSIFGTTNQGGGSGGVGTVFELTP